MSGCGPEWFDSVSAWHDGEVTPEDGERVELHLTGCAACRRAAALLGEVRSSLVASAERDVPERVRERAQAFVQDRAQRRRKWTVASVVASAAAAAALTLVVNHSPANLTPSLRSELALSHWNGFSREKPCDFESSDPDAVGGWLEERLGYPVSVEIPEGSRLLGARLCHITNMRTAAVMYRIGEEPLTVFVPPPGSPAAEMARSFAGDEVRCTTGELGSSICIRNGEQSVLAIAETQPALLARALAPSH